ncbi:MAG: hypothetical protein QOF21_1811 [Actinomycetota bacterium]|jgi:hypothetical protein
MADKPVDEEDVVDDQPGEIDEEDLEGLVEEDLIDDDELVDDDAIADDDVVDDAEVEDPVAAAAAAAKRKAEEEDEEELEVDHDVEATLDEILKERLVVVEEEEEDDEPADTEDRGDSTKVPPKRPDEFVCQSCFLVKHPSQLADAKRQYCRDCV